MIPFRPPQDAPAGSDFGSRLLGIDRVDLSSGEVGVALQNAPPAWLFFLVILPGAFLLAWAFYRRERPDVGAGPKLALAALRGALLLLVLFLLMGPVLTVETIKERRAFLIVLLDESRSMQKVDSLRTDAEREAVRRVTGVSSPGDLARLSRAEIVRKVLENPELRILDELEKKLNVAYFTFSSTAAPKESRAQLLEGYTREACIGTETAIGDAIKGALNSLKGQYVAGVVLFSDGRNNAGMATQEIAAQLRQRYLPLYTVAAGVPHASRDVALLELEARDAVLANDQLRLNLKVASFGYENEPAEIGLWVLPLKDREGEPGSDPQALERLLGEARKELEHPVTLAGPPQKQPVTLVYTPRTPGEYLLILRVAPRPDENTAHNNYLTHRLRVADDKIKVLYVEHLPRYEFRFLRNALIRDPKILAHTFQTSADPGFSQDHTISDDPLFRQPLQEFPRDLKTLLEFDVVLYGDVDPSRLGPDAAKHLEAFVTEFGGGIIFISGTTANPRTLLGTPLANLLPVIPEESRDLYEHEKVYDQPLSYVLTPEGRRHPVTLFKEFKGDLDRNQEHWEDRDGRGDGLPGVRWYQRVRKLKVGAVPVVELAGASGETSRPPLFVTQRAGLGRVFWSATDETWLWRRLTGDYPWFYPFWQQAMYWVREGKLLGARRYRVSVDKERYVRGETVQIYAYAYDEKFEPRQDPTIEVNLDHPTRTERVAVTLHKDKTRDGYYEGRFAAGDIGSYTVWAGGDDESSRASARFSVFIPDREDDDPTLDVGTLRALAAESYGGRYFPIDQVGELNDTIRRSEQQLRETKEDDLWDSPLAYLLFALLVTAEWVLRKIFRML
jgi:hypothetical protein